jgi:hypothetical protein
MTQAVGGDHIKDAMETGVSCVCDLFKAPVERMVEVNLSVDLTRRLGGRRERHEGMDKRSRLKNWRIDRF